jgi:Flp pilus assembly protein TadD
LLLFGVLRRTFELPAIRDRLGPSGVDVAFAATVVWAVHPLNSEVVDYITQRTESMVAFFVLLALYAAIRSAAAAGNRWHGVSILACLIGTTCKESIAVAPLLIALYDRIFLFESWRDAWRDRDRLYLGLGASWLVLGGVVLSGPRASVGGFNAGVPVWTYLLNQAAIIVDYLRLSVWPLDLVAFYGWPETLTLGDVLPQALAIAGLLVATIVALIRAPVIGYLGAWFFVTLAPTSSVVPIATEVGAERRMYLPLMAVVVLAVLLVRTVVITAIGRASDRRVRSTGIVVAALVLAGAAAALAAGTIGRNSEYASAITLARTVVARRPTAVAHHILGEQLGLAGQTREAEAELRTAIDLGDTRARYQLGGLLVDARRFDEAARQLEAYVATSGVPQRFRWLDPPIEEVLPTRLMLAQIYAVDRRWADVATQARLVLAVIPHHPDAQRLLGLALLGQQQWPESIAILREYLETRPRDTQARVNLGVALVATAKLDEAVTEFRQAAQNDPADANARRMLDMALEDQRAQGR